MTEEKAKQIEVAYNFYKNGMALINIARNLNKPEGTIRRWKHTYKWDIEKNERTLKNNERSLVNKNIKKNNLKKDINQVLINDKLTDKQQLFCLYYVRCFNATKAYMKAYKCTYDSAAAHGYEMLKRKEITKQINELKQNKLNRALIKEDDIFQKYMDIAFSDMTDYVNFKDDKLYLLDSSQVDGTLIDEISTGKMGTKIKLVDRMKALEWLAKHMNMATEEQKLKFEYMKLRIKVDDDNNKLADEWIEAVLNKSESVANG